MADFLNMLSISGTLGSSPITFESNSITVALVDGLTATIAADLTTWVSGPLTLTITINNTTADDLTAAVLSDTIDGTIAELDTTSDITIDAEATTDFTYESNVLELNLPTVSAGNSLAVVFKVLRV